MGRMLEALVVAAVVLGSPSLADAAILDQRNETLAGAAFVFGPQANGGPQGYAQTFTAGGTWRLERVDLHLREEELSQGGDLTVELRATDGAGAPTGEVLDTVTIGAAAVSTTAEWISVPLSADLEAGARYAIVLHAAGGGTYEWSHSGGDPYAHGSLFKHNGSWAAAAGDTAFRTYVADHAFTAFTERGCTQWTVPLGVSAVEAVATGEAGETVNDDLGGRGDGMVGRIEGLSGGDLLMVCVGVRGGAGGEAGGGDGGGASGVALGSSFAEPLIVAAGGGGSGYFVGVDPTGGAAGWPSGADGALPNGAHGRGATQTAPGDRGNYEITPAGWPGEARDASGPGAGGAGAPSGGGGGAGYFGGGGGGDSWFNEGHGGGGGSDFCAASVERCTQLPGWGSEHATGDGPGQANVVLRYVIAEAPSASVALPAAGATYPHDAYVLTSFSCAEGADGPGIESCTDQDGRPAGSRLDTSVPGTHTLTVTAVSAAGKTTKTSATYTIGTEPATPADPKPVTLAFAKLAQSRKAWRLGEGTTFSFTLSRAAQVRLAFERRTRGRRKAGRCVKRTRANRSRRACTRWVRAGSLEHAGAAGANTVPFDGRVLRAGRYRVSFTATAAGETETVGPLRFRIRKR